MNAKTTWAAITAALVLGLGGGGAVFAAATPGTATDTTIKGCFNSTTGQVRVLTDGAPICDDKTESPLSWNSQQVAQRWFRDWDGDGYGDWYRFVDSPAQPPGYVADNSDCDDNEATTNPAVQVDEGPGDKDCDGREAEDRQIVWYRDADGDGWGNHAVTKKARMYAQPTGYVYRYGDCNDHDATVHPYQLKCHHDRDVDGDGAPSALLVSGGDCNDADPHEFPGNVEVLDSHGHDEDCNPFTGGVIPYESNFLDIRQGAMLNDGVPSQLFFDQRGRLRSEGIVPPSDCNGEPSPDAVYMCAGWATPPRYAN